MQLLHCSLMHTQGVSPVKILYFSLVALRFSIPTWRWDCNTAASWWEPGLAMAFKFHFLDLSRPSMKSQKFHIAKHCCKNLIVLGTSIWRCVQCARSLSQEELLDSGSMILTTSHALAKSSSLSRKGINLQRLSFVLIKGCCPTGLTVHESQKQLQLASRIGRLEL